MSTVALIKCEDYEFEKVYDSIKKALDLIEIGSFFEDKRVLLKPNLLAPNKPEDAVTTHPVVIKALIRIIKENGAKEIYVGDSPGIGTQDIIYNVTGMKQVIEEEGAKIANFRDKIEVENHEGKYVKRFTFAKALQDVDCVVSVPKLKTHGMTYYTGAVKNLFGLVPGLLKPQFHFQFPEKEKFAEMLVDLNVAVKPVLAIMDGIVGMEGNGPRNGSPIKIGVILASRDLVALDAVACRIVGIEPMEILPLVKGNERGIGEIDESKISVKGESVKNAKIERFKKIGKEKDILRVIPLPKLLNNFIREIMVLKPYFEHKKCVMCRECIKVCPAVPKALTEKDKKIVIDRKLCIRCFCCQEMCPVGAIKPKRFV